MIIKNIFITTLILAGHSATCQQLLFFWYNYVDQRCKSYYLEIRINIIL